MTRQRLIKAGRLPALAPLTLLVVALSGVAGCAAGKADTGSPPPPGQVSVQSSPVALTACPTTLPKTGSYLAGPASTMVPATPGAARVCRYNGLNQSEAPNSLAKSGTVNAAEIHSLVGALNAATPMTGLTNCPMDNDTNDLVIFDYANQHPVYVTVALTGCNTVTNGARIRHLTSSPTLGQLAAVVGAPTGPGSPGAHG